jgi:Flp pilus assembly protein TadG
MAARGRIGRALRDDRGATALEFGIVLIPLTTLLFGAMDLARYWYSVEALRSYAADAARAAVVHVSGDPNGRYPGAVPISAPPAPGLQASELTRAQAVCTRDAATGVATISVSTSYRFLFVMGTLGIAPLTISETQVHSL